MSIIIEPQEEGTSLKSSAAHTNEPQSSSQLFIRIRQIGFSIADQGFSVGGMFLVNIALARTQTKEEYGIFALSYSLFTFLSGLHNAAVLEAYTIYGSGRYHKQFPSYSQLFWRTNVILCLGLSVSLTLIWSVLALATRTLASKTLLGMALMCGFLLAAAFIRRTFYIRRRPDLAARFSLVFFLTCLIALWFLIRTCALNGFYAFVIAALGWMVASLFVFRELPLSKKVKTFIEIEPQYWTEHWNYSRWVLATALVFQLTTQGYYWVTAGFISVRDVGRLRAIYNLVTPVDQIFVAMSLLILPMMSHRNASQRVDGVVSLWRKYCGGVLVVTLIFAGLVNLIGKWAMHVLYAGKFDEIADLLEILVFLPVIMGIGNTINDALKALEKPRFVFFAYLCSGTTTFIVGIPLVIHYGLRGAVYGLLLSGVAYTMALTAGLLSSVYQRRAIAGEGAA
jgi:O-antigen/teichoic acid export membrane protein